MMNPAHIDLFRAVVRHGGITKAAAALGLGQPHVSRAIAQLEADLGAGPLRIACQPSLATRLVPRAVRRLADERPGLRVAIHVPGPDTIWTWVASGQCDIGLARPRAGHAGVIREGFLAVDAVCALTRRHPLSAKRAIAVQDLAGEPLIAGAPGDFQRAVEEAFAQAQITPRFALMAQYTAARCGLVAEGLGLAIVDPIPARELAGGSIVLRPFQPQVRIETILIRPAGLPSTLADRLIHFLKLERDALCAQRHGRRVSPTGR